MRYLIDTNIFVFYTQGSLDSEVLRIIENYENKIYLSSESVKEIIHLFHCRKINTKRWKVAQDVFNTIESEFGFFINYVTKEHLLTMARLEPAPNHNDPTDHLIIAQAITEKIPLISSDRKFEHYRKQKLDFIYNKR